MFSCMQASVLIVILSLGFALFLNSCGERAPSLLVKNFGTTESPDGTKQLNVTRRAKALVDFEVVDVSSGRQLLADTIGSNAMRWFLHWESPTRLWGYGSDIGYFNVFDFHPDGTVSGIEVEEGTTLPAAVWIGLPGSLQEKHASAPGGPTLTETQ